MKLLRIARRILRRCVPDRLQRFGASVWRPLKASTVHHRVPKFVVSVVFFCLLLEYCCTNSPPCRNSWYRQGRERVIAFSDMSFGVGKQIGGRKQTLHLMRQPSYLHNAILIPKMCAPSFRRFRHRNPTKTCPSLAPERVVSFSLNYNCCRHFVLARQQYLFFYIESPTWRRKQRTITVFLNVALLFT